MEKTKREEGIKKREKNLINLRDRTPEERHEIAMKAVAAKKKKKQESMALQSCMRKLLTMQISKSKSKQKQVLRDFGFTDEELTNKTLLMVALFQKGMTGDVAAIREITQMMDKLDIFENTGKITGNVTINLITEGQSYVPNEQDEKDIWDAENYDPFEEAESTNDWDTDDDWGNDVYDP